jgi:hypothetical protein
MVQIADLHPEVSAIGRVTGGASSRPRGQLGIGGLVRAAPLVALTTLSVVLVVMAVHGSVSFQGDYNGNLYSAGLKILHGLDPYRPRLLAAEAAAIRAGGTVKLISSPRYPAPILVVLTPLSLLPPWLSDLLFLALSIGAVIGGLRLLGVRDWRCIAVASISWPAVSGVWLGNISPLELLACALAWRWRDRLWPLAVTVASMVAAKLFMWPVGAWLLLTRRFRPVGLAVLLALGAAAAGWAVIGLPLIKQYPQLLLNVAAIGQGRGCSLVATLMSLGISPDIARVAALLFASLLLGAAWRLARLPDGDRHAFGVILIAALIATPVEWAHYLVLVYVPIALLSPQLSWIWFLPMLAGLEPGPVAHPHLWVSLPALAIELVLLRYLCAPLLAGRTVRAPRLIRALRPEPT